MAASLLAPVSSQDMQASLAQAGDAVVRSSTLLTDMATYYLNMLTQENLDGGMLIVLGGAEPRPITPEEFDQYRLYFGQVDAIARMWTEGSPPAVGLVQPWLNLFRSTGNVRLP